MKAGLVLTLLLAIAVSAGAQTRSSLSLSVTPIGSGGATRSSSDFKSNQGDVTTLERKQSYRQERVRKNRSTLAVNIRNLSHGPGSCEAEWFFFAADVGGGSTHVLNQGSRQIALKGGGMEKFEIESAEVETKTVKKLHLSSRPDRPSGMDNRASVNTSGKSLKGWLVRLKSGGAVVESRASSPSIEALAKTMPALANGKR